MMVLNNPEIKFNYSETEDLQILELPYKGDDVAMIIILPKENDISIIEKQIDNYNISIWMNSMYPTNLEIYFPKFTFRTEYNLKNVLIDMGFKNAFSSNADFSGMNGFGGLFIDKVLHKAFIEVNEEGSEAAAATTVHILETSILEPSKVVDVDHPFVFLIKHKYTDTILFMGNVENPTL
jgi:serpin B